MSSQRLLDWASDHLADDGILLFDGFDDAFIGITHRMNEPPIAVYDYDLLVEVLLKDNPDMKYEGAVEYIDFNVTGAYVGPQTPIVVYRPEWIETTSYLSD